MSQLDEISRAIGGLEANFKSLGRSFDHHCTDDDRRHSENIEALRECNKAITELTTALRPIADTVAAMKPIVESYATSRLKFAGAMGVVLVLLGTVTWFAEQVISNGIKWFFGQH